MIIKVRAFLKTWIFYFQKFVFFTGGDIPSGEFGAKCFFRAVVVSLCALYAKVSRTRPGKGTPLEGFMLGRAGLVKGAGY